MYRATVALFVVCLAVLAATAHTAELTAQQRQQLLAGISQVRPDLELSVVGAAPIAGLYEVQVSNGPLLFVSADGQYFFDGSLYQVQAGRFVDLSAQRLNGVRLAMLADIDPTSMITYSPAGPVRARITVFTDIDCGYCRKLHRELDELLGYGIEVRYLAYPRAGVGSDSFNKIATAWCAKDPNAALTAFKAGRPLPIDVCAGNPVANHYALGGALGVSGTPAIILEDGSLIPGYQPAAAFAELLGLAGQ